MTKKEAILKLLEVTDLLNRFHKMFLAQLEPMKTEDPEGWEIIQKFNIIEKMVQEDFKDAMLQLYDEFFSEAQIQKAIKMYEDEEGRSVLVYKFKPEEAGKERS